MSQLKVPYGSLQLAITTTISIHANSSFTVRLGNSGLKVSKIILGTMQYGSKDWQGWVVEEEAIKHIKAA